MTEPASHDERAEQEELSVVLALLGVLDVAEPEPDGGDDQAPGEPA